MIAAILIAAWVLIGPALGMVIGKSIAMADRQDEVRREAMRRHPTHIRGTYIPRSWSA